MDKIKSSLQQTKKTFLTHTYVKNISIKSIEAAAGPSLLELIEDFPIKSNIVELEHKSIPHINKFIKNIQMISFVLFWKRLKLISNLFRGF